MAEKLIRDKYLGQLKLGDWRFAAPEEMMDLLRRKYWEEMHETLMASNQSVIEELADVKEVLITLDLWRPRRPWRWWLWHLIAFISRVDQDAIEQARIKKRKSKGGFHKCLVLKTKR